MGQLNRLFGTPIAVYNPLHWSSANLLNVWHDLFGATAFAGPIAVRTIVLRGGRVGPVAADRLSGGVFRGRFAGRRKGLFLVLLIAPFWISYMMRMLAWIDLLQTNGYVNKVLMYAAPDQRSRSTGWAATRSRSFSAWSTATSRT